MFKKIIITTLALVVGCTLNVVGIHADSENAFIDDVDSTTLMTNISSFEYDIDRIETVISDFEGSEFTVKSVSQLVDINGYENYMLVLMNEGGYAILTSNEYIISEINVTKNGSPYGDAIYDKTIQLLYGGPGSYFLINNAYDYINAVTNEVVNIQISEEMRNANEAVLSLDNTSATRVTPIPYTGKISPNRMADYADIINNEGPYCAEHAMAVLISYHQDYLNMTVSSRLRTKYGNANMLIDYLRNLMESSYDDWPNIEVGNYIGAIVEAFQILKKDSLIDKTVGFSSFTSWNSVVRCVDAKKPIIVCLSALYPENKYGFHMVTAYDYRTDSNNKGYYKVVDVWGDTEAEINTEWTMGTAWLN